MSPLGFYWCTRQNLTPLLWCHVRFLCAHLNCTECVGSCVTWCCDWLKGASGSQLLFKSSSHFFYDFQRKNSWGQAHNQTSKEKHPLPFGRMEKTEVIKNKLNDNLLSHIYSYSYRVWRISWDSQVLIIDAFVRMKAHLIYSAVSSYAVMTAWDVLQFLSSWNIYSWITTFSIVIYSNFLLASQNDKQTKKIISLCLQTKKKHKCHYWSFI